MSLVIAQAVAKIDADDSGLKSRFEGIKGKLEEGKGWFSGFGNVAAGVFAGGAIIGGITGLIGGLSGMVKEGMDANAVIAQTNAVLASTHGAAGMTASAVDALSQKYMALTGIDDDVITKTQNMLLTFTNIGSKGGIFEQTTKTALDMSVALGQDSTQSAMQLGKALNDPIHGISALQRVGVTFNDQQKQLIQTYVQHGDTAKAQSVILQELQKEFGGSAEASGKANGGVKILTAQFDNMKQNVGQTIANALVPLATAAMPKVVDIVGKVSTGITNLTKFVGDHKSMIQALIPIVGGVLVAAFVAWAVSAGAAAVATIAATWPILAIGAAIGLLIVGLKAAYDHIGPVHTAVDAMKLGMQNAWTIVQNGVTWIGNLVSKIGDLLGKLGHVKDAIGNAFSGLSNIQLPHFAEGGTMPASGMAMVGEHGPELVFLPAGSRVLNAGETDNLLYNGGVTASHAASFTSAAGAQPVHLTINLAGNRVADALLPDLMKTIRNGTGLRI